MPAAAINARCEFISELKQGEYGEYQSVLFIDTSKPDPKSEEAKIWINRKPHELAGISPGKTYLIVESGKTKTGKPKYTISFLDTPMSQSPPAYAAPPAHTQATLEKAKKQEIAETIKANAKLWKYCFDTAAQTIGDDPFPAILAQAASDLFNHAVRKHQI